MEATFRTLELVASAQNMEAIECNKDENREFEKHTNWTGSTVAAVTLVSLNGDLNRFALSCRDFLFEKGC